MGLNFSAGRVVDNDAVVVLCIKSLSDAIGHHDLKVRAERLGFHLTRSVCHNMLHRATGRVMCYPDGKWRITAAGWAYREHVLEVLRTILTLTTQNPVDEVVTSVS